MRTDEWRELIDAIPLFDRLSHNGAIAMTADAASVDVSCLHQLRLTGGILKSERTSGDVPAAQRRRI